MISRRLVLSCLVLFAAAPLPADLPPRDAAAIEKQEEQLVEALWSELRELPPARRPRVALVLGGGGARGLAHVGVLKVLQREKVPVDIVVGTSVGALVGALYAAGLPTEEIERMGTDIGWDTLTNVSGARLLKLVVSEQLLRTEKMESYIARFIGDKKFAELEREFACVAADLKTGEQIVLREGSVALAARASSTMPGLFRPVPYRHRLLVDGGIVNNIPTDVAKVLGADVIIAVGVPADFSRHNISNVLMTFMQALYIQGDVISQQRLQQADVAILPKVGDVSAIELWRSRECIAAGAAAARASLPELRRVLVKRFFEKYSPAEDAKAGAPR